MKPSLSTSYLLLAMHFLSGALRARQIGGALYVLAIARAHYARSCFREWLYHSRKAGAFSESASLPLS